MNQTSKIAFNAELLKANNLQEMFDVVKKYYETENTKVGALAKGYIMANLAKAVENLKAEPRKQYRKTNAHW